MTVPPRLAELLEKNELDWDNPRHRAAYLQAWLAGAFREPREEPAGE